MSGGTEPQEVDEYEQAKAIWSELFAIAAQLIALHPLDTSHFRGNDQMTIHIQSRRLHPLSNAVLTAAGMDKGEQSATS